MLGHSGAMLPSAGWAQGLHLEQDSPRAAGLVADKAGVKMLSDCSPKPPPPPDSRGYAGFPLTLLFRQGLASSDALGEGRALALALWQGGWSSVRQP